MNTKHVPTLELCQELDRLCKEKGIVVPETEFYWYAHRRMEDLTLIKWKIKESRCGSKESVPAPLVSELGEWLPEFIWLKADVSCPECDTVLKKGQSQTPMLKSFKNNKGWVCSYDGVHVALTKFDTTEANAKQRMLNYLIAEGIIITLCQHT